MANKRVPSSRVKGRPRTWLNEAVFLKQHHLLLPKPHVCVCGKLDYRFRYYKRDYAVHARCNNCDAGYYFDMMTQSWIRLYKVKYDDATNTNQTK